MRIEDKELRDLFKMESEERFQHLDCLLLELEKTPENQDIIEEVFREIHSLKGGVRMLFQPDMEAIAHRVESILVVARKGGLHLTSEIIDRLYHGLDGLKKLAHAAVTGEPVDVAVSDVIARLSWTEDTKNQQEARPLEEPGRPAYVQSEPTATGQGVAAARPEPAVKADDIEERTEPETQVSKSLTAPQPTDLYSADSEDGKFRIETIRVSTEKLDAAMDLLGELNVTKNRLVHRLGRIDEIIGTWEKVQGRAVEVRAFLSEFGHRTDNGRQQKTPDFLARERDLVRALGTMLNELRTTAHEDSSKLELVANELEDGVRSMRLLPLSTVFNFFPRMVRDLARAQSKEVQLIIDGGETSADKRVVEDIKDPLMHMIRNAIDHGIELPDERERVGKPRFGTIRIKAYQTAGNCFIEVQDDGRGLDLEAIKRTAIKRRFAGRVDLDAMTQEEIRSLIFLSGFSTSSFVSDVSGRGVGLDVVRANVERLKGVVRIESVPGAGCTFKTQLPITAASARVLIVGIAGRKYAILVEYVESIHLVSPTEIFSMDGRSTIALDGLPVSVAGLADLLEVPESGKESQAAPGSAVTPCVVVSIGQDRIGLLVNELLDEQEIVLKPQSKLLKRIRNIAGAAILGTGEICMVLNPQDLLKSVRKRKAPYYEQLQGNEADRTKTILMAEDSLTTRTQMKRILEGAGYDVVTAVDGLDAFNKIGTRQFDALVSDITMPNMDGLTLTEKLRANPKYRELPIILVTTLSSEQDRKRGLEVGASAYITKPAFDQKLLLDTVQRLT